jgi:hypothetical protein
LGDAEMCRIYTSNPEDACKYMIQKGKTWVTQQIAAMVSKIVDEVAHGLSCSSNWREALVHSISISFSTNGGVEVSVDPTQLAIDLFCQAGKRAIAGLIAPFIDQLVAILTNLCSKGASMLPGGSTATRSPSGSASVSPFDPPAGASTTTSVNTATSSPTPSTASAPAPKAPPAIVVKAPVPAAVYSVPKTPGARSAGSSPLVWGGVGVALLGTAWFAFRR